HRVQMFPLELWRAGVSTRLLRQHIAAGPDVRCLPSPRRVVFGDSAPAKYRGAQEVGRGRRRRAAADLFDGGVLDTQPVAIIGLRLSDSRRLNYAVDADTSACRLRRLSEPPGGVE